MTDSQAYLCIHMGLIKDLAGDSHYSDKWLRTGNVLTGSRGEGGRGKEGANDDKEQTLVALGAYHFAELVRQLFNNHAESLELLKHAGDVLTREAADGLQI